MNTIYDQTELDYYLHDSMARSVGNIDNIVKYPEPAKIKWENDYPSGSLQDINQKFALSIKKRNKNGQEDLFPETFLNYAAAFFSSSDSFTFKEFSAGLLKYNFQPPTRLEDTFNKYISGLQEIGKVQVVLGVYDAPVYVYR